MWPSVRRELRWARALLCFAQRDLSAAFHEEVLATDASEWGLGVVSSQRLAADVRFACKFSERWRFKHGQGPARESLGELDTSGDATRASSADLPTGHVPPVGSALVEGE